MYFRGIASSIEMQNEIYISHINHILSRDNVLLYEKHLKSIGLVHSGEARV